MSFPQGASTITLSASFPAPVSGDRRGGRIVLTPSTVLVDASRHAIYSGSGPATPNADGLFSIELLCNDDPDVHPAGWRWHVDEQPSGGTRRTYWVDLPSTLGPTVDLAELAPVAAPDGTGQSHPPTGPAGGALTGSYPNPNLAPATVSAFDPAGAAASAQTAAATDASSKVTAHTNAPDPHGDRTWADAKFATQLDLTALGGTVNSLSTSLAGLGTRITGIEQGTASLAGGRFTGPVEITAGGMSAIRIFGRRTSTGAPTTGTWTAGDLIPDSAGAWWLCTAGGTPGTWTVASVAQSQVTGLTAALAALLPLAGGTMTGTVTNNLGSATATAFGGGVTADTFDRWRILANGTYEAGPGNGARDVNWRRSAANEWTTDDSVVIALALRHLGTTLGFYGATAVAKPSISGSRGGNAAVASIATALANLGLLTDNTTA